jgi:hypothetical protein
MDATPTPCHLAPVVVGFGHVGFGLSFGLDQFLLGGAGGKSNSLFGSALLYLGATAGGDHGGFAVVVFHDGSLGTGLERETVGNGTGVDPGGIGGTVPGNRPIAGKI